MNKNYVKANLEELNGIMAFTMEENRIVQITFVANNKEYLIKRVNTYSDDLAVKVVDYPKQYRVKATILTDFQPLTEEKVFDSKSEAEAYKEELKQQALSMEYVNDVEIEIIEEDKVGGE